MNKKKKKKKTLPRVYKIHNQFHKSLILSGLK